MLQSAGKCRNKTLFKIKHSSVQYLVNLTDGILSFFILLIEYFFAERQGRRAVRTAARKGPAT